MVDVTKREEKRERKKSKDFGLFTELWPGSYRTEFNVGKNLIRNARVPYSLLLLRFIIML